MKIAIVHSYYSSDSPSGENIAVDLQAKALRNAGIEVEVIGRWTDTDSKKSLYQLTSALTVAGVPHVGGNPTQALSKFNPDIVHVHNLFPNWQSHWMRSWTGPIVSTLHNYRTVCASGVLWRDGHDCTECLDHGSARAILHSCYRDSLTATIPLAIATRSQGKHSDVLEQSDALIVLNKQAHEVISQLRPNAKIIRLANFVDQISVPPSATADPNFIYVGRLTKEKGILWLIDNWPGGPMLRVLGSGPIEKQVEERAAKMPNVVFAGRKDRQQTLEMIAHAIGLIVPSLWAEGLPTVALEALQAGTPIVISTRCASAGDLTRDSGGAKFDPDSAVELSEAVTLVNRGGDQMRNQARKIYEESYSETVWANQMVNFYHDVLRGHASR